MKWLIVILCISNIACWIYLTGTNHITEEFIGRLHRLEHIYYPVRMCAECEYSNFPDAETEIQAKGYCKRGVCIHADIKADIVQNGKEETELWERLKK